MSGWLQDTLPRSRIGIFGGLRAILRGLLLAVFTYGGFALFLLLRLVERVGGRDHRPVSPRITQIVCRGALAIMGFRYRIQGKPMQQPGAVVANHAGWLDIFALNAADRVFFVSKAEVAAWPGIGLLARATGTMFITRRSVEAARQQQQMEARLRAGHRLLFFPEGTSTDTLRVLPFKSSLFAAFYGHDLERILHVQPVTVIYHAPEGSDPRIYGWWGDMGFGAHLVQVLARRRQGRIEVIFHPPVPVDVFDDRKALAAYCERVIRTAHPLVQQG